ncbi:DDE-type integrase/transposase/recombinase [Candidatus Corynebacterium faecigallinarum]|uniref:DDE-type integrase/transposase/recombinase n=1 Tax=Candidatus Corynebacterium faecigallinarum TaxID=2838528 RepID=UPI003FCFBA59
MAPNDPIDPTIRLAISRWPDDAPRGAVTAFCTEYKISRKTFYKLRKIAVDEGPAAVLEPKSRRPHTSPSKITDDKVYQALNVRDTLKESGADYGPISVFDKMTDMGLTEPASIASLGRIFRNTGAAPEQPQKKPRSAYKRFVYPAPNCMWQIDGTERYLANGRICVIFQLVDDHSRLALASHVDTGETARGALAVVSKAIAAHGVPQKFLSDNGTAFNSSRRGWTTQLMSYLAPMGVTMVTGKPASPTTQGKNERFHQTLFKWLDKRDDPDSIAGMQALVDEFDQWYNTERRHQSLTFTDGDGRTRRMTPQQAWEATPVAGPPKPMAPVVPIVIEQPPTEFDLPGWQDNLQQSMQHGTTGVTRVTRNLNGTPVRKVEDSGYATRHVSARGYASFRGVRFQMGSRHARSEVKVAWDPEFIVFAEMDGTVIVAHEHPPEGTTYVSNGVPQGRPQKTIKPQDSGEVSPKS